MVLQSTTPGRTAVYRYRLPALILVPFCALVIQAYLPLYFNFLNILDLPLLVVIYFAMTGRSPVAGLLAGALMGVAQDSLSRDPIGLFGITNTIIGYVTSFVGSRLDTESPGIRMLTLFFSYSLRFICFHLLGAALLGDAVELAIGRSLVTALVNAVAGVVLFQLLDRFRKPA